MKSILYLSPRLDVPFKNLGPISSERGPITSLRQNWVNFQNGLTHYCNLRQWKLKIDEKPLWAFDQNEYHNRNYDYLIIPHKEKHNFNPKGSAKNLYLMQAPFPEYFSLDINGWAGNLSYLNSLSDIIINHSKMESIWSKFRDRVLTNISKFEQPLKNINHEDYVLFICQLPHDETIKYHSEVSVLDALKETIHYCEQLNLKLVVKGHPANPSSMKELKDVTINSNKIWVDDVSIHSCIKKSTHCITVNSGAGLEVILHKKPIYTFGYSEYDKVAYKKFLYDYLSTEKNINEEIYKRFLYCYMSELIDPLDVNSYHYVFNRIDGL